MDNTIVLTPQPRFPLPVDGTRLLNDGPYGIFMIAAFRVAMAREARWESSKPFWPSDESYSGLVEIARKLFAGHKTSERVKNVLRAFPTGGSHFQLLQNNKISMELLGALTPLLMRFLVGPCTTETWTKESETDSAGEEWRSKVVIERCRFLEGSKCKGMCVGLCQLPTQTFFTQELSLPLSMKPNFETGGCEMIWGLEPQETISSAAISEDPASDLRCFSDCALFARTVASSKVLEQDAASLQKTSLLPQPQVDSRGDNDEANDPCKFTSVSETPAL